MFLVVVLLALLRATVFTYVTGEYESNYQLWGLQQTRNYIQANYTNRRSRDVAWLGILDPLDTWLSTDSSDSVIQQLKEQGVVAQVAQGLSSLMSANPMKVSNKVTNLAGTPTPINDIAREIVEGFNNNGYAGAAADGVTHIMTSSWETDYTKYDMVTLMAVVSDASETNANPNGFFVYNSQARITVANLAYGSQVVFSREGVFSIRQPIVFDAYTDPSQESYNYHGTWNYSSRAIPVDTWGYTLNVPLGSMTFGSESSIVESNITFNITTASGKRLNILNTTILGIATTNMPVCQRNTPLNTHMYNPSAMGSGLWAANGFETIFAGCAMTPDSVEAVHGEGTSCNGNTYIVYKNSTDGLLSMIIPSLSAGNWVVKPANELVAAAVNNISSANKCINYLRNNNAFLNIIEPPLSPIYLKDIDVNSSCNGFTAINNSTAVIIEYAGPNARLVPTAPINNYNKLISCINNTNSPGYACFDPGLSRAITSTCKSNLSSGTDAAYSTVVKNAVLLQQQTATQVVRVSPSTYISKISQAPTSYGAITALVAAVAAVLAIDTDKVFKQVDGFCITARFKYNVKRLTAICVVIFTLIFAQIPIIILCITAFDLDGQTGYQYIPSYSPIADEEGNNVYLVLQVSAIRLTYNTPLLWLYPVVMCVSVVVSTVIVAVAVIKFLA